MLACRIQPLLPQPQYWLLSNHSIASVVGFTQPGYQWSATAKAGANVSGAPPSGMPDQEVSLSFKLPLRRNCALAMLNEKAAFTAGAFPAELKSYKALLDRLDMKVTVWGILMQTLQSALD